MHALTTPERALLDIESQAWLYRGVKESAILERTGWSPTRAMVVLAELIDTAAAQSYAPMTCRVLRERRDSRGRSRRSVSSY